MRIELTRRTNNSGYYIAPPRDFEEMVLEYFDRVDVGKPLRRNDVNIAIFYTLEKPENITGVLNIKTNEEVGEPFYDIGESYTDDDYTLEGISGIEILLNDRHVGYYIPNKNVLLASDWIDGNPNYRTAKYILNVMVEKRLINKSSKDLPKDLKENEHVTLGGDPEFELLDIDGGYVVLYAEDYYSSYDADIGCDGSGNQVEFRPAPAHTPKEYVENIRDLIKSMNMPISTIGDIYPLGGHVHVGGVKYRREYAQLLDAFLGKPLLDINGKARRNSGYGELGDIREQPWGFEYRVLPATIYVDPEFVRIVYKIVQNSVEDLAKHGFVEFKMYNGRPTKEAYLKYISEEEYNYFMSKKDGLLKKSIDAVYINKIWGATSFDGIFVQFSGDYFPRDVKEYIRNELESIEIPDGKRIAIRLFGLRKDRGYVYAGEGLLPNWGSDVGKWTWGLSYQSRAGDMKELRRVVGIIKSVIEERVKNDDLYNTH